MVRAIFFDFYSVWTPDKLQGLLDEAVALGPGEHAALAELVDKYYHGRATLAEVADAFRWKLGRGDIDEAALTLRETDISPTVANLMRVLHGHFVKLGVLGNLGKMELELLNHFNASQQLFEVIMSPLSIPTPKPLLSRDVFGKALGTIDEQPGTCLVISGHDDYLSFASGYGMQTIKYAGLGELGHSLGQLLAKDIPSFVMPLPPQ